MHMRAYEAIILSKVHFLPVAYSSSPKSCMIYPIDFSISSILLPENKQIKYPFSQLDW